MESKMIIEDLEVEPDHIKDETFLLFLDTLSHSSQCFNSDEILFKQPVTLQLIRIIKPDSLPHPEILSTPSMTQVGPIRTFEVFAKNLDAVLDRFEVVLDSVTINENPEMDTLIPFSKPLNTSHLILRGEYEKITLAIYGKLVPPEEVGSILNKQFDIIQPMNKEDNITPLLSPEDEEILAEAKRSIDDNIITLDSMTDIDLIKSEVNPELSISGLASKMSGHGKSLIDTTMGKNPNPTSYCNDLTEYISDVKNFLERIKFAPEQIYEIDSKFKEEFSNHKEIVDICINGLNGGINGFCEIDLALALCKYASMSAELMHELIVKGLLQSIVDIMLKCRTSEFCLKILDAIHSLVNQEEFLSEMQNAKLNIKNKPEIIFIEQKTSSDKSKKSHDHDKKKHRHDSKDSSRKQRKSDRSSHKRSKSKAEEEKVTVEKKKKVVTNSLGEIVEADYEILTLYQLVLSLLMAKQNSLVLKKVKFILKKIFFITQLREIKNGKNELTSILNMDCICEYLQENSVMTNELAQLINHYGLIEFLMNVLKTDSNIYTSGNTVKVIKWILMMKNGLSLLEDLKVPEDLAQLSENVNVEGIHELRNSNISDNFQLFKMLRGVGKINKDRVIKEFYKPDLNVIDKLVTQCLLTNNPKEVFPAKLLIIKQEKRNSEIAAIIKKIYIAVEEKAIVAEAANDVVWGEFPLLKVMEAVQERSPEGLLILLNMILTLIKQPLSECNGFIHHIDLLLEVLKTVRKKLEDDEFPSRIASELKEIVESLLMWLEAYDLTKDNGLADLVKTLWSNLPTASSFNISFNEINPQNFIKQIFGAAYVLLPNLPPFFLGSCDTSGAAIVFFNNAYRSLSDFIVNNPHLLYRLLEAGLLSHLRHILLSISNCFEQWTLPNVDHSDELCPILASKDYFELVLQILKLLNVILPRIVCSNKHYDDSVTVSSLTPIFAHMLNKSLEDINLGTIQVAVLNEILEIFASWLKQDGFAEKVFMPEISMLLIDLPIRRIAGVHLLMFMVGLMDMSNQEKLNEIKNFMFSKTVLEENKENMIIEEDEEDKTLKGMTLRQHGSIMAYILNELYESYDAKFISMGVCSLKHMANTLPYDFAMELVGVLSDVISNCSGISIHTSEVDLVGTPTSSNNKLVVEICRRLLLLNELIPSMLKYALLQSDLPNKIIDMLQSLGTRQNNNTLEKHLLKVIKSFCTVNEELIEGRGDLQFAVCELSLSIPQMLKIMNLLSQRSIISPHIFTGLSNGSIKEPEIVLDYLNAIKVFVSNPIGRSIALFGDYVSPYPSVSKVSICFKELIDQCHELLKLMVPKNLLLPIFNLILDISLILANDFDEYGNKLRIDGKIHPVIADGISSILTGDANNIEKFKERFEEFAINEELEEKYNKLLSILTLPVNPSVKTIEICKSRSLDQIYKSYTRNGESLLPNILVNLLKPRTYKQAESIYLLKHDAAVKKSASSILGVTLMVSCYESFSDDWVIECLSFLESSVVEYFANVKFIIGDTYLHVVELLNEVSNPEKLELEHANLLLSIQTMKRRQRSDVERKRSARTKAAPATVKLVSFNPSISISRKPTTQQPSRNISTHVDVFEGLDKGMKSPFPQAQKSSSTSGKPSTPTHSGLPPTLSPFPSASVTQTLTPTDRPMPEAPMRTTTNLQPVTSPAPPHEEKGPATSKCREIINLLNRLTKASDKSAPRFPQRSIVPHQVIEKPSISLFSNSPASFPSVKPDSTGIQEILAQINQFEHESSLPGATMMSSQNFSPMETMSPIANAPLTEEEENACERIRALKQQHPNDPRTQELIARLLRQYKRIGPYVSNTLKNH